MITIDPTTKKTPQRTRHISYARNEVKVQQKENALMTKLEINFSQLHKLAINKLYRSFDL